MRYNSGPFAVAKPDRTIKIVALEINRLERCRQQHFYVWIGGVKAGQSWNQPSHGEGRISANLQLLATSFFNPQGGRSNQVDGFCRRTKEV